MRYSKIGYLISEGFRSIVKQKKMTSASVVIMCATMFMFGIFFLIGQNVNYVMQQVSSQQGMRVIIKEDASADQIATLKTKIQQISDVNQVTYSSKEDALVSVKNSLGDQQGVLEGYDEDNPFPASYFVTLKDLSSNQNVQKQILSFDGVDEIESNDNTISNLAAIAQGIQIVTLVLLILLVIISIFIISYTIKLTVYARRKEISIMKYVGATNGFIRGPFLIEGIIIGIISAFITLAIIGIAYSAVIEQALQSSVIQRIGMTLYGFSNVFVEVLAVYLILGIGIGIIGSAISMRKYLKV